MRRHAPRLAAAWLAAALLAAPPLLDAARALAAPASSDVPRETVLRGEVVETGCFIIGNRRGELHKPCALACARAGQDLGILDDKTKTLYVLVQDLTAGPQPNPLLEHVASKVEVRGTLVERGGINGVVVRQVRSLSPSRR